MTEHTAAEKIILAIDTPDGRHAHRLAQIAKQAGARYVKMGLELSTALGWRFCSQLAEDLDLEWVADAKLDDIPNTVAGAVEALRGMPRPPFAITMHTTAGKEAMQAAQTQAGAIKMLGVTVLTSIGEPETRHIYRTSTGPKVLELARDAAAAGLAGVVASPLEVGLIKDDPRTRHLFAMIPGTRSPGADHGDQTRVATPAQAIQDGADLLVIGRQITQAPDPAAAFRGVVAEIETVL